MLRKNSAFLLKTIFSAIKSILGKRNIQVALYLAFFVSGVNLYQYKREDFVVFRTLGDYKTSVRVLEVSKRHDIDPLMVTSVIVSESSGYPFAVSYMNARGLMQLMPKTALYVAKKTRKDLYRKIVKKPGMIYHPDVNMELAVIHLKSAYKYMAQNWKSALHIYNLGGGAFSRGQRNFHYVKGILKRFKKWKGDQEKA
jgi:soluble lytic murein transglycosylase-like protein